MEKRPAVIICPGGAYRFKSDREAEVVALRSAAGMQAFVLQYSGPSRYPSALRNWRDGMGVRSHGEKYCIDTDRIVIAGFSAGGHLCACLGNLWDESFNRRNTEDTNLKRAADGKKMWKPVCNDFKLSCDYDEEFTHQESRTLLLGENFTQEYGGGSIYGKTGIFQNSAGILVAYLGGRCCSGGKLSSICHGFEERTDSF